MFKTNYIIYLNLSKINNNDEKYLSSLIIKYFCIINIVDILTSLKSKLLNSIKFIFTLFPIKNH